MSAATDVPPGSPHVIDLGAGDDPDPRATLTVDLHAETADYQFDLRNDWPLPDDMAVGLVARHSLEHIAVGDYDHVFEEAARVLKPGGWFDVHVPVGCDAVADPTHRTEWQWRTPDLLADADAFWVPTIPFCVDDKRLHCWFIQPLELLTPVLRFGARTWGHEAWYELPGATGELIIRFRSERDA